MAQGNLLTAVKTPPILAAYCSKAVILTHITVQQGQAGALFHMAPGKPRSLPPCGFPLLQGLRGICVELERECENYTEEVVLGWMDFEVTHVTSAHIPLTTTQFSGHN